MERDMIKIKESDDVRYLRETVLNLWKIIDNIDTFSDMAKDDNEAYRKLVTREQSKRWDFATVDSNGDNVIENK